MAHPQEKRDALRRKYVFENQSLEVAATLIGIPFATARNWKYAAKEMGDDWDKMRSANLFASGGIETMGQTLLAGFLVQYQSAFDDLEKSEDVNPLEKAKVLASLTDSYLKVVNANKKLMPETQAAAVALLVVEKLMQHISEVYPDKLADFALILQTFEQVMAQEFA
ncbi:MAG: DUF1804 family protein [Alysiella sp.]|uniref:DUF1804 family protein n=1 Tax=Alysiella sp. TaxID=1872483 RepID=UPI0026DABDA4|nr:DUF1804 family protein [Alysiella sp.]MDO4434735.1 DUF1804 family protein [Alysiella sp.]